MNRFNWGAFIVGGLLAATALSLLITLVNPTGAFFFFGAWLVTGYLIGRAYNSWSTAWAIIGISFLLLPVFGLIGGMRTVDTATASDAEVAGAAIGSLIGAGVLGFFGFFLGLVFIIIAFLSRRRQEAIAA